MDQLSLVERNHMQISMATNVEIKARVRDLTHLKSRVSEITDTPGELIPQVDVFFSVPQGRLKLRRIGPYRGELIYYERVNLLGPKESNYYLVEVGDPDSLEDVLSKCLGIRGVVRKKRWLYMVGETRVHLDEVEDLGSFMELEVVLSPGQTIQEGGAIARQLMERLGIEPGDLVEGAYIDLMRLDRDPSP